MSNARARAFRNNPTDAERYLWRHLRLRQMGQHKFRRQQPVGPYVVDFVCLEKRLVVELDGGQHAERSASDAVRTAWLKNQGFHVLRFWNDQVLKDSESVKEAIWQALMAPHPIPPHHPLQQTEQRVPGGEGE